jgi:hypothetical protein
MPSGAETNLALLFVHIDATMLQRWSPDMCSTDGVDTGVLDYHILGNQPLYLIYTQHQSHYCPK